MFLLAASAALALAWVPKAAIAQGDVLRSRNARETDQLRDVKREGASEAEEAPAKETARPGAPLLEKAVDPDAYVLGPGDELVVSIMSAEPRTYNLAVLPEGYVLIPGVGAVHADGRTLNQFRAALASKLDQYFRDIELYCYLSAPARFRVFVTGEVARPGAVEASGVERVTDAIESAGGIGPAGSRRMVRLERGGDTLRVDLQRFLSRGDFAANPYLRGGDRIHVPPRGERASIFGPVKKPGFYDIVPGETVRDLFDLAGSFTSDAATDSVLLTRVDAGGTVRTVAITSEAFGTPLADMDEVGVFDRAKGRRAVRVEGATARTGRFVLAPGEGIAELIVRAGGFTEKADLRAAYIDRRSGDVIETNLQDILSPAPKTNIALEDGDVLTVPAVATTVTVGGEVNKPGEFDYSGDLTVAQYIGLAGGPTKGGSVNRVVLYAPDGSSRGVSRDARPGRGDVIIVKRSTYSIAGEFFSGLIRLGTVVVSIIVLTK